MSRSGYSDDYDDPRELAMWRGAVNSAIRGKRGQQLLRELADAMDAMPQKRLIANDLEADGEFCALGVVGCKRGIDMKPLDPEDREAVAQAFNIAPALAAEIVYMNDEYIRDWEWVEVEICGPMRSHFYEKHIRSERVTRPDTPERRWQHMREWVEKQIAKAAAREAQGSQHG